MVVLCVGGMVLRTDTLIISKEILDFEEQVHARVVGDPVHNALVPVLEGKGFRMSVGRLAVHRNVKSNLKDWLSKENTQGFQRHKVNTDIQGAWKTLQ